MDRVRRTFSAAEKSKAPIRRWSAKRAVAGSARWRHYFGVDFRLEPDQQFAAEIEHGSLDDRGLRQHQGKRFALVQAFLVAIRQFAKRGAGAVKQRFPAQFVGPALEFFLGDARRLVIMKAVSHAMAVEPGAGLLHGVAVLDAVDGDGQANPRVNLRGKLAPQKRRYRTKHPRQCLAWRPAPLARRPWPTIDRQRNSSAQARSPVRRARRQGAYHRPKRRVRHLVRRR